MTDVLPPIVDRPPPSDLRTRSIVGALLVALALAALWAGGWGFALFVLLGVLLVWFEWCAMHALATPAREIGALALIAVVVTMAVGFPTSASVLLAGGIAAGVALLLGVAGRLRPHSNAAWAPTGLLYAALPAIALIWMRAQPQAGFQVVLWAMATVWATDIFAYAAGRTIGGPKIAPRLSPKKTWAGLVGGMIGAAVVGGLLAAWGGWPVWAIAAVSAALAGVAQAGDFWESWLKRKVGIKDSGTLLPGHGGIMDRVDGLVPVSVLVAAWLMLQDWLR